MITNYSSFKEKNIEKLRYYCLDWDDNILHMPTIIHMDKLNENMWQPIDVSPSEFAIIRNNSSYRVRENNPSKAYEEFRDYGPRGFNAFLEDVKHAIQNNKFGPSWGKFIKCLKEGSLFAIITARGHEYETIKEGVKYIIDNCLSIEEQDYMHNKCLNFSKLFNDDIKYVKNSDRFSNSLLIKKYLDSCRFYGVGNPYSISFKKEFGDIKLDIEEAKKMVLDNFIKICDDYGKKANLNVSLGFSDDDKKNVEHVKKFFEFKSTIIEHMKLNVFDTSNKGESIRTKFQNGLTEDMGASLSNKENSILRFNNFTSMSNNLQNATNDFSQPNYTLLQKAKVANMLTKKTKKKFVKKFKKIKSKNSD